jgi:hypothetical protein
MTPYLKLLYRTPGESSYRVHRIAMHLSVPIQAICTNCSLPLSPKFIVSLHDVSIIYLLTACNAASHRDGLVISKIPYKLSCELIFFFFGRGPCSRAMRFSTRTARSLLAYLRCLVSFGALKIFALCQQQQPDLAVEFARLPFVCGYLVVFCLLTVAVVTSLAACSVG